MRRLSSLCLSLVSAMWLLPACELEEPAGDLEVSCDDGKCDGFGSIRSLIADARKLDLGDLLVLGAGYATDGLNDALGVSDYASIELRPTEFYAVQEVVEQDLTLNNLDSLVSGLAARFGEQELTTEVNRVRAAHLRDADFDDTFFAESAFKISAQFGHSWNFASQGLLDETSVTQSIGFDAGADLEARIISAYGGELEAVGLAPLSAINAARGFIFPTKLDDVRDMRPGESFALKGEGAMGINVGAGVPILIAEPVSFLTYNVVLTAGLRSQLAGQMDVQLVRLEGDQVVIDVGMEVSKVASARIGLRDGWGISGLVEQQIDIAGVNIDLGQLVEKALQKQLNKKLNLISAEASKSNKSTRMSVARMRFFLNGPDPRGAREEALAQALKGDLRLAQALASRGDSGVSADFDLIRSGVASTSHAGIEILGMHFFATTQEAEGTAVIQTPGGATSLMFESLHKDRGWFFSSHGYGRTGLAGLMYDSTTGGAARGETNLFLSVQEGDKFLERDKMLDHLDGLIVSLAGSEALEAMEVFTNPLEQEIMRVCPVPSAGDDEFFDDACNMDLLENDATVDQLRGSARFALQVAVADLDVELQELLMTAGDLKIAAQSLQDANAALVGPRASIVLDYRLDDGALLDLFSQNTGADVQDSVLRYLEATQVDRVEDLDLETARASIRTRLDDDTVAMAEAFDAHAQRYLRIAGLERARVATVGELGSNAVEIRFTVDKDKRVDYENAVSQSLAQARSAVVTDFFDDMVELADDIGRAGGSRAPHDEQTVAYGLLGLSDPVRLDLRVDIDVDTSSCALCGDLERYDVAGFAGFDLRAQGAKVSPIGGGLFDIDSIINLQ